ncbi:LD-carboxypeptidase [Hassallia byssoidea VB512170]|uniref:LD-carboxypeptidase n=1 Tax=Hassallia byssoidea VB512170 TaxID=1304833 RepID=A0A846HHD3_9CYAN|nr:LD-carboxypeptidase [Hassalia byssoidea]NEU76927.1 LD-carboxypeptidase [Hassalia byssoidea VB512170]
MQSQIENSKSKIVPPFLKPGDLLRVIAPSGALREFATFERGVEIWRSRGYKVEISPQIDDKWGYLAGKDETRRQQLAAAWQDPECRGILCARGGFGSTRILENWNWGQGGQGGQGGRGQGAGGRGQGEFVSPSPPSPLSPPSPPSPSSPLPTSHSPLPKWLIGFSDITALLWSLEKAGIAGVHAPVLTTLSSEPDWSVQRLFDWVEGRSIDSLKGFGWGGGIAKGILLPANLTVATHLLNTPFQPNLNNVILAFEDVTEAPYRIDRMLTQWRMSGALSKVSGIALGSFTKCEAPADVPSLSVEEVLRDRLSDLGIPVVSNLPFGHEAPNAALPVGVMATLDADEGILSVA